MSGYRQIPIESTKVWNKTLKYKEGPFEWLVLDKHFGGQKLSFRVAP